MWAFNALLMLLGATGPSAYLWLSRSPGLGSGLATYAATDGTFLLVALVFLRLGVRWGRQQYPHVMAPYLGAWIEKDGRWGWSRWCRWIVLCPPVILNSPFFMWWPEMGQR